MMIAHLPVFRRGTHYREQSPEEAKGTWRWITARTNCLRLPYDTGEEIAFLDAQGIERGRLLGNLWKVNAGYAWNGCSPKRWVPVFGWIGTPDVEENLQASFWHDFLCQFRDCRHFPLSREQVDRIFYEIMRKNGFRWAGLYHGAVRDFGLMFKAPADGSKSVRIPRQRERVEEPDEAA